MDERGLDIGVAKAILIFSCRIVGTEGVLRLQRQIGAQSHPPFGVEINPVVQAQIECLGGDLGDRSGRGPGPRSGPVAIHQLEEIQRSDEIIADVILLLGPASWIAARTGGGAPALCAAAAVGDRATPASRQHAQS